MLINLIEYFDKTVNDLPNRTAVVDGGRTISFIELKNKSLILASAIDLVMASSKKPVAVFLPKSIESVYANIAIIYSGNFYMNLDIKSPQERIRNILQLIEPGLIITNLELSASLSAANASGIPVLNIDELPHNIPFTDRQVNTVLAKHIDTDPLCIINTSGSTGTPKGVVLNHKSFIDFTEWAIDTLKINDNEIIGSLSPVVFDIYSFELCMLMAKGSCIVVIPETISAFPANILKLMQDAKISFIFWVPTIMVNVANMDLLNKIELPHLKTIWFAGEVFPTKQFNYWKKHLPESKFVNLYGPIEITLDCTYFIVDRELKDDEPIPIGYACRNTDVLILNDKNESAGVNEEGELCVRGTSLAMGYYNNPEKTSAAFVQNPLNKSYPEIIYRTGDLVYKNEENIIFFKGRKDTMIKHLGYRIELGEIEHVVINTLHLVKNGCVIYNYKKKEIILFYESPEDVSPAHMRKQIAQIFPKYMLPNSFVRMDELPRNTNGKIDRLLLSKKVND